MYMACPTKFLIVMFNKSKRIYIPSSAHSSDSKYAFYLPPLCLCRILSELPDLCKIPSLPWSFFIYLGKWECKVILTTHLHNFLFPFLWASCFKPPSIPPPPYAANKINHPNTHALIKIFFFLPKVFSYRSWEVPFNHPSGYNTLCRLTTIQRQD